MSTLSRLLDQPEYVHAAINHFPLIGLFVATLALIAGLIARSRSATVIAVLLVAIVSLSVWPVVEYGEAGYDRVLSMADEPGQAFLKHHAAMADRWVFLYYVTAGVGALGLGLSWKFPRLLAPTAILTILLAASSLTAGIAIAHAGGEVRHREFRLGPPPS